MRNIHTRKLKLKEHPFTEITAFTKSEDELAKGGIAISQRTTIKTTSHPNEEVQVVETITFDEDEIEAIIESIRESRRALVNNREFDNLLDEVKVHQSKSPRWKSVRYDALSDTLFLTLSLSGSTIAVYVTKDQRAVITAKSPDLDNKNGLQNVVAPSFEALNDGISLAYSSLWNIAHSTTR